uniref:Ninjurin 1 n=1 Tax=Astatotilapia calliptera TaxID=8154 RepID=A0A3P8N6V8_ASTCA
YRELNDSFGAETGLHPGVTSHTLAQPRKALRPIDMNHYATKKRAAQSMLDVALLMANSSQLKTILYVGPQYRFYVPLIMLLTLSSALQVIVGLLLVFIVHAFISSRLNYCNSLLSGCPKNSLKSLQLIQNAAARVLTGTRKREQISPVLASLHWLPVKSRIQTPAPHIQGLK